MDEAEFVEEQNFFIHLLLFIGFLAEQKFVYCVDCFGNPCFFKKAPKKEKAPRPSSNPAKSGSGFQLVRWLRDRNGDVVGEELVLSLSCCNNLMEAFNVVLCVRCG
ncbi:uncharacterized protein LOC113334739 [Papaver somniferum]|uniref:uncharacterized protein LOC113334739 n=1 Tax=Papaver somniferum TaxID=3469 RepID=UPI000E702394|nr:uncharacterized protein LOC113334739 [Papaver somniferum]XP_026436733.1 uncharacterized protein LOC113334739 [Papaver somniferum]